MASMWNPNPFSFGNGGTGLASREAVEGFAYGAQLQQQNQTKGQIKRGKGNSKSQQDMRIRDVWSNNLAEEMDLLEQLVDKYKYISMDTEFPGIVARPMGAFTTKWDYHYQCLRCNVDLLKVIQLGISLFDEDGNSPPANLSEIPGITHYPNNLKTCPTTWQFNFRFSLDEDMYSDSSISFLQEAGLDLKRFESQGIDPEKFGSRLVTSGLAHYDDVRWISYHSGYDFAYLIKLMNQNQLPEDESEYRRLMRIYFPSIFDIKYIVSTVIKTSRLNGDQPIPPEVLPLIQSLATKGGLQNLADELQVRRVGMAHFAGSDALLTGKVFWEVKRKLFGGNLDLPVYVGQIWGLNTQGLAISSPPPLGAGPAQALYGGGDEQAPTPHLNGNTLYNHPSAPHSNPPSTPASSHAALAGTPQQSRAASTAQDRGLGSLTPSGGGGMLGQFRAFGAGKG